MNATLREALRSLAAGRPSPTSRMYRGAWTDGTTLFTYRVALAVPLADGRWVLNNSGGGSYTYWVRRDLGTHLAAHNVDVVRVSHMWCRDVTALLASLGSAVQPGRMASTLRPPARERVLASPAVRATPALAPTPTPAPTSSSTTVPPTATTNARVPRLGFELEVEFGSSYPQRATAERAWGLGPVEGDGSLRSGWEFKTSQPSTLQEWRSSALCTVLQALRELGAIESAPSAGLHVHVDRASFTPPGLVRLFQVVNHADQVLYGLSRRGDTTNYCRFTPRPDWANAYQHAGKYSAVHLHPYYPTAELRLFRSTVAPQRLFAALEAAEALWAYCETTTLPANGVAWAEWVAAHPNYQWLAAELRAQRALAPAAELNPVEPLARVPVHVPEPAPAPVAPVAPPAAPAPQRVTLGTAPNNTVYYWNPTAQQLEFRSNGTYRTSQLWAAVQGPPEHHDGVHTWVLEQLTRGGHWTPPAPPVPAAPAALTASQLPTTGQHTLGRYGGATYRWNGELQLVEYLNDEHTTWQRSSSQFPGVRHGHVGQDRGVLTMLQALAAGEVQAPAPLLYGGAPLPTTGTWPLIEAAENEHAYRWNGDARQLQYCALDGSWTPSNITLGDALQRGTPVRRRLDDAMRALTQQCAAPAPLPTTTPLGRCAYNSNTYRWNHTTQRAEFEYGEGSNDWRPSTTVDPTATAWLCDRYAELGIDTPASLTTISF